MDMRHVKSRYRFIVKALYRNVKMGIRGHAKSGLIEKNIGAWGPSRRTAGPKVTFAHRKKH